MEKTEKMDKKLRSALMRLKKAEEELALAKESLFQTKIKMVSDFIMYEQIDQTLKLYCNTRTEKTQQLIRFAHSLDSRIKRKDGETDLDIMQKIARVLSFSYCKIHQQPFITVDDLEWKKLNITYLEIEKEIRSLNLQIKIDWGTLYRFFTFDNFNPLIDLYITLHTLHGLDREKMQTQQAKKEFKPNLEKPFGSWQKFEQLLIASPVQPNPHFLSLLNRYRDGDDINCKGFVEDYIENMNLENIRPRIKHFTTHLNMMVLIAVHCKMNNYSGDDKPALDPTIQDIIKSFEGRMRYCVSKQTIYKLYSEFELFYEKNYACDPEFSGSEQ